MGFKFYANNAIDPKLSGIPIEYCIVEIFSRDRGHKSAYLQAYAGGGPPIFLRYGMLKPTRFQDDFDCLPSREVTPVSAVNGLVQEEHMSGWPILRLEIPDTGRGLRAFVTDDCTSVMDVVTLSTIKSMAITWALAT
jgi:hypothetical protein